MPSTLLLLLAALLSLVLAETNGTEAYFISPHGLGRTPEVDNALAKMAGQIRVKRTTYNHSTITYVLDNVTIGTAYNDARQTIEIPKKDNVKVTGGRVEFTYKFNYTKTENRNNVTGYAYGRNVLKQDQCYQTPSPTTRSSPTAAASSAGGFPPQRAWRS
jgi:hypothetical protein